MPNQTSRRSARRAAQAAVQNEDSTPDLSKVLEMKEFSHLEIASSDDSVQLELGKGDW